MAKIKLAILASGSGSNAEAIMKWAQTSETAEVVCVLSDKKEARVLKRAEHFHKPALVVSKKRGETKEAFDQRMLLALKPYAPDWIVLAGFMRILSVEFLKVFERRVVNIHPSLLPLFPGADGYGDAFRAQVDKSGCTIHYVEEGVDSGEIIAQKSFPLRPNESLEEFKKRGLEIENAFYPEVLEKLLRGWL